MNEGHEEERLRRVREALPALKRLAHFNTGTVGPLPLPTFEAMAQEARRELEGSRGDVREFELARQLMARTRQRLARLVGAFPEEVAITHHTSEGINIVLWGLPWHVGDELLTTAIEHEAAWAAAAALRSRMPGIRVKRIETGLGERGVEGLQQALTPRTRLVVVSHVSYSTGALLPVEEMARIAHANGTLVLVDGAQSAGCIPVNVGRMGADFYAFPGQKWLLGPEGTGALVVRREHLGELEPTFGGYLSLPHGQLDAYGHWVPYSDARRYEVASFSRPAIRGLERSLEWLEEEVGWAWIFERTARMARAAVERLQELPFVKVLTPLNQLSSLVNFEVEGTDPARLARQLIEAGYLVRSIPGERPCLRISTGFFNSEAELDGLVRQLTTARPNG